MIKKLLSVFKKKNRPEPLTISDGLDDNYLFDFRNYASAYRGGNTGNTYITMSSIVEGASLPENNKIAIKPIDVLDQLETVPTPWTLTNLDDKIAILKIKEELITQYYSKREVSALIERLENRKKWGSCQNFFNGFQNTTDEKIGILLEKYDLQMNTSDLFIPEFPDDAIDVMQKYTEQMIKLCKKKPVFYVIAEPDKFRKAYEKRDPILLVQSPFGFYWQILGAWDKEMLLLSEL